MHLPLAIQLTIQWSARVPLREPELGVKGGEGAAHGTLVLSASALFYVGGCVP
jgi:hypothetical protein